MAGLIVVGRALKDEKQKGTAGMRTRTVEFDELWAGLSEGERRLIGSVMGMLKGARRSQIRDVARAAAKWERGIGFFIKVRLTHERPRRHRRNGWMKVEGKVLPDGHATSSPSNGHSQPGASPNPH